MLPPEGVIRAATRWLVLLAAASVSEAWLVINSSGSYADLSQTQYVAALEWLETIGLVDRDSEWTGQAVAVRGLTVDEIAEVLFARCLVVWSPPWLRDSDSLIRTEDDLPFDASTLADIVGLRHERTVAVLRQVHGRVDLEQRRAVGASGEAALVSLLSAYWVGDVNHASLIDDGLGYDVHLSDGAVVWHVEVKSTSRRGRLTVYLSRHEFETAKVDSTWRLVVVGLEGDELGAVAVVRWDELETMAPRDQHSDSRWESARFELTPHLLDAGLPFLTAPDDPLHRALRRLDPVSAGFSWMPQRVN